MFSLYDEAWMAIGNNQAALDMMRDSEHHTISCQEGRKKVFAEKPAYDRTLCFCDLMVHLAAIVREARNG